LRNKGCVHPHLIRFIPEFAPGSIGSAYTYSGPLSKGRESEHHFWGFPQVILSLSQSVPNSVYQRKPKLKQCNVLYYNFTCTEIGKYPGNQDKEKLRYYLRW